MEGISEALRRILACANIETTFCLCCTLGQQFVEELQCLWNFHYDAGRQGIKIIHVSSFVFYSVFLCQLHMHTCPLFNVLLEVGCCCFPSVLNMVLFVGSQSYISPPSFMFVSLAVSEICELNQNKKRKKEKKNSEISYLQFNTFPGHIIYPFFNQRYLLSSCTH